jgi:hypothetical protein
MNRYRGSPSPSGVRISVALQSQKTLRMVSGKARRTAALMERRSPMSTLTVVLLKIMPFGNSVFTDSKELELHGTFDRFIP